jgi:hypothetical protein
MTFPIPNYCFPFILFCVLHNTFAGFVFVSGPFISMKIPFNFCTSRDKVYIDNNVYTPKVLEFSQLLSDIHCPISFFIDHVKQY